jgi:hypothetical protein
MVQTYHGYFHEDVRFIPDGSFVKIPTRRRAIVSVFIEEVTKEDTIPQTDPALQDRIERIGHILAAASEAEDDIMTDDDWDEMQTLRSRTNAGLSRTVKMGKRDSDWFALHNS